MTEKIIDKNLLRITKIKMCTSNLSRIEEIEDISIQDINLMQNKLNIDLTEIVKLENLKNVSLKFFEITDEIIDAINELKHLETIEFLMCTFKTKKTLSSQLKSVVIYNCKDFEIGILGGNTNLEQLQLINSGMIDINKITEFKKLKFLKIAHCNAVSIPNINILENLEQIYLNHIEIPCDIDISRMLNLKFISLSGSNVSDKKKYIEKLYKQNNKLKVEFEKNDLPIE